MISKPATIMDISAMGQDWGDMHNWIDIWWVSTKGAMGYQSFATREEDIYFGRIQGW